MKVLVLGCGPAGLIAAYAARREFGAEVQIVSTKRKSLLFGCQYLHAQIPGLQVKSEMMSYRLRGSADEYRHKVYGNNPPAATSPQQYEGDAMVWDIRETYDLLYEYFESCIIDETLESGSIIPALSQMNPDHAISSVPLQVLCQQNDIHAFTSREIWAIGDGEAQRVPIDVPPFTVMCDGTDNVGWYRASNVFDYKTVEWPGAIRRVPVNGVVRVKKPLNTDCDCLGAVLRVGRYGRWQKGVLAHESYEATCRYIQAREAGATV